jgi:DNA invertase Pin-like site-specific DNA recombinase
MSEKPQVRAGVYGRESQGKIRSIEDQLADGRAEAASIGWTVVDEYQDKVSASRHASRPRDDWPKIMKDVRSRRINGVIVRDSSRADRRPAEWIGFLDLCRDTGTLIRSVTEHYTYDVRVWRDYRALADEGIRNAGESERLRDRVMLGQAKGFAAGRPAGGPAPFGYARVRRIEDKTTIVEQVPDVETAPVVRFIYKEIGNGRPIQRVLEILDKKYPKDDGTDWYHSHVRRIIANPAYAGLRKHNGAAPTRAEWPALVAESDWYAANRALAANLRGYRPGRVSHLLSGTMTCMCDSPKHEHRGGVCGARVGTHTTRGGYSYMCRSPKGCTSVTVDRADAYILKVLSTQFADEEFQHDLLTKAATSDAEVAAAQAEVDALTARLEQWRSKAANDSSIDPDNFVAVITGIERDIKTARRRLSAVSVPPPLREALKEPDLAPGERRVDWGAEYGEEWVEQLERAGNLWVRFHSLDTPARRGVIRDLMEIKLYPVGSGYGKAPIEQRLSYRFR